VFRLIVVRLCRRNAHGRCTLPDMTLCSTWRAYNSLGTAQEARNGRKSARIEPESDFWHFGLRGDVFCLIVVRLCRRNVCGRCPLPDATLWRTWRAGNRPGTAQEARNGRKSARIRPKSDFWHFGPRGVVFRLIAVRLCRCNACGRCPLPDVTLWSTWRA
jgi:hypothetical protein